MQLIDLRRDLLSAITGGLLIITGIFLFLEFAPITILKLVAVALFAGGLISLGSSANSMRQLLFAVLVGGSIAVSFLLLAAQRYYGLLKVPDSSSPAELGPFAAKWFFLIGLGAGLVYLVRRVGLVILKKPTRTRNEALDSRDTDENSAPLL